MDRRRVVYVIGLVVSALLAITGVCGMITGIYYLCQRNSGVTVLAAELIFYSGISILMGWQQYNSTGRKNWRRSGQTWQRLKGKATDKPEELKTDGDIRSTDGEPKLNKGARASLAYRQQKGNTQSHLSKLLDLSIAFLPTIHTCNER
jgi:hypothetical protein